MSTRIRQSGGGKKKVAEVLENCVEQGLMLRFAQLGSPEVRAGPAKKIRVRKD